MLWARGRGGVASRDRELGRHAAGLDIPEVWTCAAGVQTWRHRGVEVWNSGGALRACRREGVQVWSPGGVLQV